MNHPTREEFEQLKEEMYKLKERQTEPINITRLDNLEKQNRESTFIISDIAHKTTIALGILTAQESDIKEIKVSQAKLAGDVSELKTTVAEQGKRMDTMDSKLDQILALLKQRPGD